MITNQLGVLAAFVGFPLLSLQAAVEDVDDDGGEPGDAAVDTSDSYLDVVQISVFIWSRQVVRAEGAEQQSQKEIQHLLADRFNLSAIKCHY